MQPASLLAHSVHACLACTRSPTVEQSSHSYTHFTVTLVPGTEGLQLEFPHSHHIIFSELYVLCLLAVSWQ
jgi:hypothetical protein